MRFEDILRQYCTEQALPQTSRNKEPTSSVQGRSDGVGAGPPGQAGGVTTRADSSLEEASETRGVEMGAARAGGFSCLTREARSLTVATRGLRFAKTRAPPSSDWRARPPGPLGEPTRWKP